MSITDFNPESDRIVTAEKPRPRGLIEWNPRTKTRDLLDRVDAIFEEYREQRPLTIRQIFYRLVGAYGYAKDEKGYGRLKETLAKARRAELIPFHWIRDDGIQRSNPPGFVSEEAAREAIRQMLEEGVVNPQEFQAVRQIVLCEAGGMVPQLARVADEFGVEVISSSGFDGLTAKYDLAEVIANFDQPCIIHHIGDFDASGVHLYQSLVEDVCAFALELGGEVAFRRLAVTPAQIEELRLPTAPPKKSDNRRFEGQGTVQAEAIAPTQMARILQTALAGNFDFNAHERAKAESDRVADQLRTEFKLDD
jgi:hypothetical protein